MHPDPYHGVHGGVHGGGTRVVVKTAIFVKNRHFCQNCLKNKGLLATPAPLRHHCDTTVTQEARRAGQRPREAIGLLLDTMADPKHQKRQKHHFLMSQNQRVKTDIFSKKAYLMLIVFAKMSIFAIFGHFGCFLDPSETPLKSVVFDRSKTLSKPYGNCQNCRKTTKNTKNPFLVNFFKMSPRNLRPRSETF